MKRKIITTFILLFLMHPAYCEEAEVSASRTIQDIAGLVMEIAEDGTFIVIGDMTIITHPKFIESSELKLGDRIRVIAKETEKGLEIISVQFDYKKPYPAQPPSEENPERH